MDNSRKLYDALNGQFDDLGSYEEFAQKIKEESNRLKLYNKVKEKAMFNDLGSYEEYSAKLGYEVKPVQQEPTKKEDEKPLAQPGDLGRHNVSKEGQVFREGFNQSSIVEPDAQWEQNTKNALAAQQEQDTLNAIAEEIGGDEGEWFKDEYAKRKAEERIAKANKIQDKSTRKQIIKEAEEQAKQAQIAIDNNPFYVNSLNEKAAQLDGQLANIAYLSKEVSKKYPYERPRPFTTDVDEPGIKMPSSGAEGDEKIAQLQAARNFLNQAKDITTAPLRYAKADSWLGNRWNEIMSAGKGVGDILSDPTFWSNTMSTEDNMTLVKAIKKVESATGKADELGKRAAEGDFEGILSEEEQAMLSAYVEMQSARAERANNTARMYNVGKGTVQTAEFMLEMALTAPMGAPVQQATTKAIGKFLFKQTAKITADTFVKNGLKWGATKGARLIAGQAGNLLSSGLRLPFHWTTAEAISEKALTVGEDGKLISAADAIIEGGLEAYKEIVTEGMGKMTTEAIGSALNVVGVGKILDVAAKTKPGEFVKTIYTKTTNSALAKATGWDGLGEEFLEEFDGAVWDQASGNPDALREFFESDNLLTTIGTLVPMSVIGGTTTVAKLKFAEKKRDSANNLLAEEMRRVKNQDGSNKYSEDQIRYMIDALRSTTPQQMSQLLTPIVREAIDNNLSGAVTAVKQDNALAMYNAVKNAMVANLRYTALNGKYESQESQQREDKKAELEQKYGTFYQNPTHTNEKTGQTWDTTPVVETAKLNDGRSVFILSAPSEKTGQMTAVDGKGNQIYITESDIATITDKEGNTSQVRGTQSLDGYLSYLIMQNKKRAEATRMQTEVAEQTNEIAAEYAMGAKVTLGTPEAQITGEVVGYMQEGNGVVIRTQDGQEIEKTYEELANEKGTPIQSLTDEQIENAEVESFGLEEAEYARLQDYYKSYGKFWSDPQENEDGTTTMPFVGIVETADGKYVRLSQGQNEGEIIALSQNGEQVILNEADVTKRSALPLSQFLKSEEFAPSTTKAEQKAEVEEVIAEEVVEETPETPEKQLPLKADGSVDENALWTNDPAGWAEWNDERKQDGGADSLNYINNAVEREKATLRQLYEAYQQETDFDKRNVIDAEMNKVRGRLSDLMAVQQKYQSAQQTQAQAQSQVQPSIVKANAAEMTPEQLTDLDKTYNDIYVPTRSAESRVQILQEYLNHISQDSVPVRVLTKQNYEQVMRDAGCTEKQIAQVGRKMQTLKPGQGIAGMQASGCCFVMVEGNPTIDNARSSYVHERQHVFNNNDPRFVNALASLLGSKENAISVLAALSDLDTAMQYENMELPYLANEIICRCMESAYKYQNFSVDLQNKGVPAQVITLIEQIDNEQRNTPNLSLSRRYDNVDESRYSDSTQDDRGKEQISKGILGQQGLGSIRPSERGVGVGETGAGVEESAEVDDNEDIIIRGIDFRITKTPDSNGLSYEQTDAIEKTAGELEYGDDESAATQFSIVAIAEGVGLNVVKDDGEGNVAFVAPDGKTFDANNPITAEDLKSIPDTPFGYMMADAKAIGNVSPSKEWMLWKKYALMLNAFLEKGSAENGGIENLQGTWQFIADTVYKTVATNSDSQYSYSLDITRVCKKNEAVINAISEMQRRLGYGITPGQIMDIYLSTIEAGYQVPCPVCYVFSRYIRNGKYATIMINGQRKYGSQLVDPRTLTEKQKKERIAFWLAEKERIEKENETNKSAITKANEDITTLLKEIDALSKQITDPKSNLSEEQKAEMLEKIHAMDARYRAALNVVSQSSLDSWITQFAIYQKKVDGKMQWFLYEDTYKGFPDEAALDMRMTSTAMRLYPAIQRYRNSRGSGAGKEITFVSNNDIGDVPMALGSSAATKDLARPADISDEEFEEMKKNDEYADLKLGVKNLYRQAAEERDPKKRTALLKKARERFASASKYAKQQSLRGGQRMWSWSDNIERLAPDVFVNLMQLEMLGGALQSYSKQLEGIKLVASMNGYVNGSLMGKGNGYREVGEDEIEMVDGKAFVKDADFVIAEPGKKPIILKSPAYQHTDGKWYTLEFDDVVGIDAFGKDENGHHFKGLFDLNAKYDKAGNILVGMNDLHIRMAMMDDRVFFIIPWHSSGANQHILAQMYDYLGVEYDVKQSQDYTDVQGEKRYKAFGEKSEEKETKDGKKKEEVKITEHLVNFWADHYENAREINGYGKVAGKDFRCGIEGGIENSDGNGFISASQAHYRELRDAIFNGIKVQTGVDKNGKPKYTNTNVAEANPEWFNEIMNDEFLSQVYDKIRTNLGADGRMTSADSKSIYPYEYWDESSTYDTADINGVRYLEYCRRLGYKPKFCGKLDGKPAKDYGNFVDDKGYWKTLIDRRMYGIDKKFQDLSPVTAENFTTDLVDPVETAKEFIVTRVADEQGTQTIVDSALAKEESRGGVATVDYDLSMQEALDAYNGVEFKVRTDEQKEKLFDDAKAHYGVTKNFNAAGYMLPDGSLLDFSEANDGGNPNERSLDHRDIEGIIMDEGTEYDSRWMYIADFLNEGAIRLLPESAGINLSVAPTAEQRSKLFDFIYKYRGEVILEISDDRMNSVAYVEYNRGTAPARIFRDIDGYFRDGIIPQQDVQFKISNDNQRIFVSNAAKAVEGIQMGKATPEQWLKMIEKNGGLKAGEDKWMGLSDWLKSSDKKTLTKDEVMQFINENMIQIEETHYGEESFDEGTTILDEKYPGYGEAFSFDYDDDFDRSVAFIEDEETAVELYNNNHNDTIEFDEDGNLSAEDTQKLEQFGAELADIANGITTETKQIYGTRLNYTTRGLTNNHEIALTVPTIESWNENDITHFGDAGEGRAVAWIRFGETMTGLESNGMRKRSRSLADELEKKYGSMWNSDETYEQMSEEDKAKRDEADRLYHLSDVDAEWIENKRQFANRMAERGYIEAAERERRDADEAERLWSEYRAESSSKKVLVIDEIQSKRHQEGREKGYKKSKAEIEQYLSDNSYEVKEDGNFYNFYKNGELERRIAKGLMHNSMDKAKRFYVAALNKDESYNSGIPDAPFDKNWHELAMKRMLRYAAENGYDVIAWTKGDQQAERYNIGSYVSSIEMQEEYDGNRDFGFYMGDSDEATTVTVDENGIVVSAEGHLSQAEGRPLADLVGKDMAVKMMQMEEYDVLEDTYLKVGNEGMKGFYDRMLPAFMNKYGKKWGVKVEDIELPNLEEAGRVMHSVPVTEEMKQSVMEEGQVMFKIRGANESAMDFAQQTLADFRKEYNVPTTTTVVDVNDREAVAGALGYTSEEFTDKDYDDILNGYKNHGRGVYEEKTKRVAIFVDEAYRNSPQIDHNIFHENTHWIVDKHPELLELGEWLWNNSHSELASEIKGAIIDSKMYEGKEFNETLTAYAGIVMASGYADAAYQKTPTELQKHWDLIFNTFGYEPERENRRQGTRDNSGRVESSRDRRNAEEQKHNNQPSTQGLSAEERRQINEYLPGFEEVEFKVNSHGQELTNGQQEFFANSKAVDKDGNLLVLYHGTPRAGFTEFKGGWFTTSKKDADSYAGNASGKLFDPNEKYEPTTLVAGDYALGYMTFDSEEDRRAFLEKHPNADTAMPRVEYNLLVHGGFEDEEMEEELYARKSELEDIWRDYAEYSREHSVHSTIGAVVQNPELYTEWDLRNAITAFIGQEAAFDSADEILDLEERKAHLVDTLNYFIEDEKVNEGNDITTLPVRTRVPRNGEGVKYNDLYARTYEAYINVESPYEIDAKGVSSEFQSYGIYKEIKEALSDEQYDGVIIRNWRVGQYQQLGDVVVPKNGNQIKLTSNENPTGSEGVQFKVVTDSKVIEEFEAGEKGYAWRSAYINEEGELYSPMASRLKPTATGTKQQKNESAQMGQIDQAVENPDMVDEKGHITILDEDGGKNIVAYNPYDHCCINSMMNDQFKRAWERDNLFVVRVSYPKSEETSGYHAYKAKDPVGIKTNWKAGAVGMKLPENKRRHIMLTRLMKNLGVEKWEKVANDWIKTLEGENIDVPFNCIPRKVLNFLADAGVNIVAPEDGMVRANAAYEEWKKDPIGYVGDTELPPHIKALNESVGFNPDEEGVEYKITGTPTSEVVEKGLQLSVEDFSKLAGNIYESLPENVREEVLANASRNDWDLQNAIFQIPTRLAEKEDWTSEEAKLAEAIADKVTDAVIASGTTMKRLLTPSEALWMLYQSTNPTREGDLVGAAREAVVAKNLGFDESVQFSITSEDELDGIDKIVADGKMLVSAANQEAADAFAERINKINGNLAQLRMAAAAQREYDQNTVKAVVNVASALLEKGMLSPSTRREVVKLLNIIRDAVGKKDLTISANRLMDLMISNQLRYAEELLKEYLKVRDKKVDARGIEVQGKLDINGQQIMQTIREAMKLSPEKIDERIAIAENNLDSPSETIKRNAENELVALNLAKQLVEEIKTSKEEEADLRTEIKGDKVLYDEGRITKEEHLQFLKEAHEAIREIRIQRVKAYQSLTDNLAKMMKGSIENAERLREAEKARVEKIHHFANSDMQGMPSDEHTAIEKNNSLWNSTLVRFFLKPLATFDQMLRSFAPKSRLGEGYLWNHFMNGWMKATENEYKGVQAAHEALDAKAREVFGKEAKRWSDIFSIDRDMPSVSVKFWDGGKMKDHKLTQGNLLYIYMVNKMPDGRMKLRKMGITEDVVASIVRNLDPRFIEIADWLQGEFLPSLREKYNALHEKMFGAPMAAIDNYFPIRVLANARVREVDLGVEESNSKPSTITGSIIKRTKNALALDVMGSNAFDVILEHIQDMEHWHAFAEWNRDLNTLLSYKKFRNRVQNMTGIYGAGTTAWNNFRTTAEIAAGVYKPAAKPDSIDKLAVNLAKSVTGAKISFRVYTAIKQLLSMPAFVSDANIATLAKNMATPWVAWNWAMENLPMFEKRWKSRQAGDSRLMQTESDYKIWKTKFVETASRLGMTPNALVDAVTVAIGARSIYETKVKQYIKDGYSQEKAEEKAKRDATILFNESQQSNESAFLSAIQIDRTASSVAFSVFRNSSMGYQRMLVDAVRNFANSMRKGYREDSIEYMKKQMVRDGLTEEQAARAAERIFNRSFIKNAARVATFGFLVQFAWNLGAVAPYILYQLCKLVFGGGDDEEELVEPIKDAAVRALVGAPIEGLTGGSVLSNFIGNIVRGEKVSNVNTTLLPVVSDFERLLKMLDNDWVAASNEMLNIFGQMVSGVNPQTFTDVIVAVVDACNGDLETSKEALLCMMRVLQVPQSQIEKVYIDEIGFTADKGLDMRIEEFAKRYADYKVMRGAPMTGWLYSNEDEKKAEDKFINRFLKTAEELKRTKGNETAKEYFEFIDGTYKEIDLTLKDLRKMAREAEAEGDIDKQINAYNKEAEFYENLDPDTYGLYEQAKEIERDRKKVKNASPEEKEILEDEYLEMRNDLVEQLKKQD